MHEDSSDNPAAQAMETGTSPLRIGMDDRHEPFQMISWWDQPKIAAARVLVIGSGAIGNEVIKNLALLGVGTIVVTDFDLIESTNLSRSVLFRQSDCGQPKAEVATRMAGEMSPQSVCVAINGRIPDDVGLALVENVDVVIGCVDNREARLWINRMCWRVGTAWIDGGIQEISGVAKVFAPPGHAAHVPDSGCYECTMTSNDYRLIQLRYSCPLLTREEILEGRVPTTPTIASIIAGLQVQEMLKLIHGLPSAAGSGLVFNGAANRFYQTRFPFREDCLSHETALPRFDSGLSAKTATARELIGIAEGHFGPDQPSPDPELQLDRDFVVSLTCDSCGLSRPVNKVVSKVSTLQGNCEKCQLPCRPEMIHTVGLTSPLADVPLCELGIPLFDIVRVRISETQSAWLRLDGDRPDWLPAQEPEAVGT